MFGSSVHRRLYSTADVSTLVPHARVHRTLYSTAEKGSE